jgi:hypothetical protein
MIFSISARHDVVHGTFIPEGQADSSQAEVRLEFGHFQSLAQGGLKSIALGAMRYGDNRLGIFEPDRARVSRPFSFKAKRLSSANPGH